MFTGIISDIGIIRDLTLLDQGKRLRVETAYDTDGIELGASIANNGVCLTVEKFDSKTMQFTIGYETLQITGWTKDFLSNKSFNLEKSCKI